MPITPVVYAFASSGALPYGFLSSSQSLSNKAITAFASNGKAHIIAISNPRRSRGGSGCVILGPAPGMSGHSVQQALNLNCHRAPAVLQTLEQDVEKHE